MDAVRLLALLAALSIGTAALADQAAPASPDTMAAPDTLSATVATDAPDTLAMPAAPAAKPGRPVDRTDKVPRRYPLVALSLSAVFPGGGQLYTQKYLRAAAFAGTIGYCGYHFWREDREMRRLESAAPATRNDSLANAVQYDYHYEGRRGFQWWGIGIWLFSLADAYVDAHLFKFDERSDPAITLRAAPDGIALCARF
ncbi:MAG: DUF5683 domain-containing protein [Candidatus Edwardsbacteria bacterium]|jgi:hypothetical protein|nr:DUF5683 domain-containing protein [Candidatus Edwardsbacteria bacterium]